MASIYEMTDGDARSVANANNYLRNKFGVLRKPLLMVNLKSLQL